MLMKPILTKSTDRSILPKRHPILGVADEWFNDELLSVYSYSELQGIDFFVNWKTRELSNEFWIKRIIPDNFILKNTRSEYVQSLIYESDGEEKVKLASKFFGGKLRYKLFRESENWDKTDNYSTPILDVMMNIKGEVQQVERITLEKLKQDIRDLSGGPVKIGGKGLFYSTSTLEHYLSTTDALWPGDVDLIIFDSFSKPNAIIEFKKHTKKEPIENHKFNRYYPRPDGRKYERLVIFKDSIAKKFNIKIPLIVLYYPTEEAIENIVLEEIIENAGCLIATNEISIPIPKNREERIALVKLLIDNYVN